MVHPLSSMWVRCLFMSCRSWSWYHLIIQNLLLFSSLSFVWRTELTDTTTSTIHDTISSPTHLGCSLSVTPYQTISSRPPPPPCVFWGQEVPHTETPKYELLHISSHLQPPPCLCDPFCRKLFTYKFTKTTCLRTSFIDQTFGHTCYFLPQAVRSSLPSELSIDTLLRAALTPSRLMLLTAEHESLKLWSDPENPEEQLYWFQTVSCLLMGCP